MTNSNLRFAHKTRKPSGVLTSKCEGRTTPNKGQGVFATRPIFRGELIVTWGGRIIDSQEYASLNANDKRLSLQLEDDLFLLTEVEGPADWVNHSCSPNTGMSGQVSLLALRDIEQGEEITFDYAMTDGCNYDEFDCLCGSISCRKRVSGNDWQRPELWARYGNHFSPYLLRRIKQFRSHCQVA